MKKILLVMVTLMLLSMIYAQSEIKPYGSVRVNYWEDMVSKELSGFDKADADMNFGLQSNSRMGINFKSDGIIGKVEYGTGVNLRLLYAKQDFGNYTVLIGQDYDGISEYAGQVYGTDNGLIGYGAVDGSRNPQIKFEMKNGFYAALIKLYTTGDPAGLGTSNIDASFPKMNFGFKYKSGPLYVHPSLLFQSYAYDKDAATFDEAVTSWLFACTGQYDMKPFIVRAQINYGSNTGFMGISGPSTTGNWNASNHEITNTSTLGGFGEFSMLINEVMTIDTGFGYASSSNDKYISASNKKVSDSQMAVYAQLKYKIGKLTFIPEIGLQDKMKDKADVKEGNLTYFGSQFRIDF